MLLPKTIPSKDLIETLQANPFAKDSIKNYILYLRESQNYLDKTIFNRLRRRIEKHRGYHFNFKRKEDKAEAGRYIIWGELSYRQALPPSWQPLHFFPQATPSSPYNNSKPVDLLADHWHFTALLSKGRILDVPSPLNGMERTPLFKVFGQPTTLDQLNHNYRLLRMRHHPDVSPYSQKEANERFHWLGKAYQALCDNWSRFDPTSQEIPRDRVNKQFSKTLAFNDGWWYWNLQHEE